MPQIFAVYVLLAVAQTADVAPGNPVKLATTGRFDLSADSSVEAIDDGGLLAGEGTMERMNWLKESDRPRGYTVNFAISHIAWREVAVRFKPRGSGTVRLALMGAWEEKSPRNLYRQDVLWDAVSADGTTIENGGFEAGSETAAAGWQGNGLIHASSTAMPAAEGNRLARTWHNQTLTTTIRVTREKPVTIRLRTRAALPEGFQDMNRIADRNTPAHQAAKRFLRGTNLGNYLEAPPRQDWGASYSTKDFEHIQAEGFDHVRLPVAWHHHTGPGPEFRIKDEFFAKVDFLVNEATKHKLAAIVNFHHFDPFTSEPAGHRDQFIAIWRQVAEHYAAAPQSVAFELLNEPKDAATTEVMNPIYTAAIREIRKTNPTRTILVGTGKWNQVRELPSLRLPDDDRNLIVTLHCYDPFQFTHQGASWTGGDVGSLRGVQFPGPPQSPLAPNPAQQLGSSTLDWIQRYNSLPTAVNPSSPHAFRGVVQQAKEWSDYYGRPVHLGEFGAYERADAESRARFCRAFREALDEANIGWAMWDWKAGFKYWDAKTEKPCPGMREALFGNPENRGRKRT